MPVKNLISAAIIIQFLIGSLFSGCGEEQAPVLYPANHDPLLPSAFLKLPLGSIKPLGWLKDQLVAQRQGLTGHLEDFWPDLINSAWKGGDGEAWERGPYYLDGLVPLAYLLDDAALKAKAQVWIEALIKSQQPNGWFGPVTNTDRWPLAIACKALIDYYEATLDKRALDVLDRYFTYLQNNSPDWPDSTWRGVRAMEHAVSGYWLYRQTKNPAILETIRSIWENSFNWTTYYHTFPWDSTAVADHRIPHNWDSDGLTAHVVNNAMAIKYPGLWYQQSGQEGDKNAVFQGIYQYDHHHGQIAGRFSGDEHLSGKSPTQGTEMCAVIEYMFSLEKLIEIFSEPVLADRLEYLAYNALPGTMTPDCWAHQYDQQTNQVLVSNQKRAWSTNGTAANIYGLMPNYPCCLANMHQGWPKFTEHLWMASRDGGLALIAYGPAKVSARVGRERSVTITEHTNYPFEGSVKLSISTTSSSRFPLYLRIPGWSKGCVIRYRGKTLSPAGGQYIKLMENWENGDQIMIVFSMKIALEERYNQALAVRRGPLYFALRIGKNFERIYLKSRSYYSIAYKGSADWSIKPTTPWNYALLINQADPVGLITVSRNPIHSYPFSDMGDLIYNEAKNRFETWPNDAPVILTLKGVSLPDWKMNGFSAAYPSFSALRTTGDTEQLQLVPYGCARLRIAEFPALIDSEAF